jgi:hypothetical protein
MGDERFTLGGWRLVLRGETLGTAGPSHHFNSGFTYYSFRAAPALAEVQGIFDRVNQTWKQYWDCDDEDEERLYALNEAADKVRAALPLTLVSESGLVLSDAIIHLHMEDSPTTIRVKLGRSSYDKLRASGLLPAIEADDG